MNKFAELAFHRLLAAKVMFGNYSYHDKGANEVMDLGELTPLLRAMTPREAGTALEELEQMEDTNPLVQDLVSSLDDWDGFFECPENEELIGRHY